MKLKCIITFPKEEQVKLSSVMAPSLNARLSEEMRSTPFHRTSTCLDFSNYRIIILTIHYFLQKIVGKMKLRKK